LREGSGAAEGLEWVLLGGCVYGGCKDEGKEDGEVHVAGLLDSQGVVGASRLE
jgi:hypothetical protein